MSTLSTHTINPLSGNNVTISGYNSYVTVNSTSKIPNQEEVGPIIQLHLQVVFNMYK
jgi:hypothetical protein